MMNTIIYALLDPNTNECRYIGKTKRVALRHKEHCQTHRDIKTYRSKWMRSLLPLQPIFVELEIVGSEWEEAERWWIQYMRFMGARLVNATSGGEGGRGLKHSAETKAKLSAIVTGIKRSEETRAKMSRNNAMHNPVVVAKYVKTRTGMPVSDATKAKISLGLTGKQASEETKAKMSRTQTERRRNEQKRRNMEP